MKTKNESAPHEEQEGNPLPLTNEERDRMVKTLKALETTIVNRGAFFCFFADNHRGKRAGLWADPNGEMDEDRTRENLYTVVNALDSESVRDYTQFAKMLWDAGEIAMTSRQLTLVESGQEATVQNHLIIFYNAILSFSQHITSEIEKLSIDKDLKDDLRFAMESSLHTMLVVYRFTLEQLISVRSDDEYMTAVLKAFTHLGILDPNNEQNQKSKYA